MYTLQAETQIHNDDVAMVIGVLYIYCCGEHHIYISYDGNDEDLNDETLSDSGYIHEVISDGQPVNHIEEILDMFKDKIKVRILQDHYDAIIDDYWEVEENPQYDWDLGDVKTKYMSFGDDRMEMNYLYVITETVIKCFGCYNQYDHDGFVDVQEDFIEDTYCGPDTEEVDLEELSKHDIRSFCNCLDKDEQQEALERFGL